MTAMTALNRSRSGKMRAESTARLYTSDAEGILDLRLKRTMNAVHGRMIEFPSNAHKTPGYLAVPEGDGKFPGVIAIQEWWGLVGHIKDVADRLAAEGFAALAPDLYHGQIANEPNEARKLAMALDRRRAVDEILAAASYLRSLEIVQPAKVGVIGWCMGGGLALTTAASSDP